jgi:hypothetical protein
MERRKFLIGIGSATVGGSALLGSGAFSRVESHRQVAVQVANDANAYLGFLPLETPNSNNYFDYDDQGHAFIDIADQAEGGGEGINSNSLTWFDGLFELCNQGKAPITRIELDGSELTVNDENDALDVWVYSSYDSDLPPSNSTPPDHWNRRFKIVENGAGQEAILEEDADDGSSQQQNVEVRDGFPRDQILGVGSCTSVGLLFDTKGDPPVDASGGVRTLVEGELSITAVAPDAGQT